MRRSKAIRLFDFSGGQNSKAPVTSLEIHQAVALDNIRFLPNGGFEGRQGNTLFNATPMNSGANVQGLAYYRKSSGSSWLVSVCGSKIYKTQSNMEVDDLLGVMDDITGALTVSSNQDNIWTFTTINDTIIGCGGPDGTADATWAWPGTGNAAALGGSPPAGGFCFTANNRVFIGDINSNRSLVQWCILADATNWSGSGSGSQQVQRNDGDTLVGGSVLNMDHAILFKQNSIHDLIIRNDPFPLFPLFRGVGAVSKRAIVNVDGTIYFLTPEPRMKATNGSSIAEFPDTINDVWDGLNKSRLKYSVGYYYPKQKLITWLVSNGSATTHNLAISWDLVNKCWLLDSAGFKMNAACLALDRILYTGNYSGSIYKQDVTSTYTDASESNAGISAYWQSGWMDMQVLINTKIIPYVELNFTTQTTGSFEFSYGFDFQGIRRIVPVDMQSGADTWGNFFWGSGTWGGQTDNMKRVWINGSGKFLQFMIKKKNASQQVAFNGMEMPVKSGASTEKVSA